MAEEIEAGSVSNGDSPQKTLLILDSALFTLAKETGLISNKNVDR